MKKYKEEFGEFLEKKYFYAKVGWRSFYWQVTGVGSGTANTKRDALKQIKGAILDDANKDKIARELRRSNVKV